MIKLMEMVYSRTFMVESMKESGRKINNMGKAKSFGRMELLFMRGILLMVRSTDMVGLLGVMVLTIRVNFQMDCSTDLGLIISKIKIRNIKGSSLRGG
jgi:hypothetical protein